MKGTGFIVLNLSSPEPAKAVGGYREHPAVDQALAEAKRLAAKHPGETFAVYEPVLHAKVKDPVEVTEVRRLDSICAVITNEIFGTARPDPIFDPLFYRLRNPR